VRLRRRGAPGQDLRGAQPREPAPQYGPAIDRPVIREHRLQRHAPDETTVARKDQ